MEWLSSWWTWSSWNWWVLGLLMGVVEILAPGIFFLWFALSALVVGFMAMLWPEAPWQLQVVVFALLGGISAILARLLLKRRPSKSDEPGLNRRLEHYFGRTAVLEEAISNGRGRIRLDDTSWSVEGPDLPAGTRIRITGSVRGLLQVQADSPPTP
ncbi:MAG: NfeD family protein [Pseudomonadota bacterium]|nr:NfeD family protein [Pseudomonadota bacterium]